MSLEIARRLYGEVPGALEGVLHVVAVADEPEGRHVLRIGPHAPASETDGFVLGLARARVEAILVTGAVLRAEPHLRYALPRELARFRREGLGLAEPPILLVLSAGDAPPEHPALASEARPVVLTSSEGAAALRGRTRAQVVEVEAPSARAALRWLREERGCRSTSVEAGPRTAVPLYGPPCAIDELMLSVFEGELDPRARGGAFLRDDELRDSGLERLSLATVEEPGGRWRFERWRRR